MVCFSPVVRPSLCSSNTVAFARPPSTQPRAKGVRSLSKAAERRKRKEKDRRHSDYINRVRKAKKLKLLHPAAKWKRILSACDYWFSDTNLVVDGFLREELKNNLGYCRIKVLLTFPKLQHWATPKLLLDAFDHGGPRFQVKQHPSNPKAENALVRKKGVTLESIKILESNPEYFQQEDPEKEERAEARRKQKQLRKYETDKEIVVVQNIKQLANLCERIRESITESVEKYGTDKAAVLGLDAEYATLDTDIRPGLPAMLQISALEGPVGLIWLDKFPDHGRNVLNDNHYAPLATLLADPNIIKVGCSIEMDAKNLAAWWGINDREYVGHFITRMKDLSHLPELDLFLVEKGDSDSQMTRLSDLCAAVLGRNLVKMKSRREDKKKSHWRAPVLTDKMKTYAAHDATCAVDIWMRLMDLTLVSHDDKDESSAV